MQGFQRRVVYITLYEGIAIVAASAGLALMTDAGLGHSGVLAVAAYLRATETPDAGIDTELAAGSAPS